MGFYKEKTLWKKGRWRLDVSCAVTMTCIDILPCLQIGWKRPTRYFYGNVHITFRWLFIFSDIMFSEECLLLQEEKKKAGLL